MAVVTIVASAALWTGMLWLYSGRTIRFVRLVPLGLPLSTAVNLLVKGPFGAGVGALAGIEPGLGTATPLWFLFFLFALAPVFEELVKVVPVLLPAVRRTVGGPDSAFWTGMALGIGFGLGEAMYLAWGIAASGAYEQYPWYAFTGFLSERLLVVFLHGLMTALFMLIAARRVPILGFLAAAASHALLNSGAMLFQLGLVPEWVASLTLAAVLIAGVALFERIRPKTTGPGAGQTDVVYYSAES